MKTNGLQDLQKINMMKQYLHQFLTNGSLTNLIKNCETLKNVSSKIEEKITLLLKNNNELSKIIMTTPEKYEISFLFNFKEDTKSSFTLVEIEKNLKNLISSNIEKSLKILKENNIDTTNLKQEFNKKNLTNNLNEKLNETINLFLKHNFLVKTNDKISINQNKIYDLETYFEYLEIIFFINIIKSELINIETLINKFKNDNNTNESILMLKNEDVTTIYTLIENSSKYLTFYQNNFKEIIQMINDLSKNN